MGKVATWVLCSQCGMGAQDLQTLLGGSRFHTPTSYYYCCCYYYYYSHTHTHTQLLSSALYNPTSRCPEFFSELVPFNPLLPRTDFSGPFRSVRGRGRRSVIRFLPRTQGPLGCDIAGNRPLLGSTRSCFLESCHSGVQPCVLASPVTPTDGCHTHPHGKARLTPPP